MADLALIALADALYTPAEPAALARVEALAQASFEPGFVRPEVTAPLPRTLAAVYALWHREWPEWEHAVHVRTVEAMVWATARPWSTQRDEDTVRALLLLDALVFTAQRGGRIRSARALVLQLRDHDLDAHKLFAPYASQWGGPPQTALQRLHMLRALPDTTAARDLAEAERLLRFRLELTPVPWDHMAVALLPGSTLHTLPHELHQRIWDCTTYTPPMRRATRNT